MKTGGDDPILCVGLTCLDVLSYVPRFPAEDSQLLVSEQRWAMGGNAANNATVLRQLGASVRLFSAMAQDAHTWPVVEAQLAEARLDWTPSVRRPHAAFPVSTAIINEASGSRTILHKRSGIQEPTFEEFQALELDEYSWIHFEARGPAEVRRMMDAARRLPQRPKISVEVEKLYPGLESLIPGADFVFVSKDFARDRGWADMRSAVAGVASSWADAGSVVVCAWGELGAAALDSTSKRLVTAPAFPPPKVVDTLGAGDSFVAGTLRALLRGEELAAAIEFGCRVAGAKVAHKGLLNIPFSFPV